MRGSLAGLALALSIGGAQAQLNNPLATAFGLAGAGAPTGYINVMGPAYGAKGNTLSYGDGTITTGTNAFSSASATFTAADVGKSIMVDYAGVALAPLVTTISGFTDSHHVTLAANASTTVPYSFLFYAPPATAQSGGGSYAPNDTVTLAGGTFSQQAVATVKYTTVVSATINAAGTTFVTSAGLTTGSCVLQGTTGAGPQLFSVNVTITAGAITAVGSLVNAGSYTTNPTSLSAEPVTSAVNGGGGTCTGGAGATLTLVMGILVAQPSTAGVYSALPSNPVAQASTSGSGTGATFTASFVAGGAFMYGTDDTAAWTAAINASNTANATGQTCIFAPEGSYLITSSLPTWTTNGCIVGTARWKTIILVSPALSGDVFSWSEAWAKSSLSINGSISKLTGQAAGPILRDLTMVADRTSVNTQNAVMLYDRNDYVEFANLSINNFNGYCLASGLTKNTAQAYVRESDFTNIDMFGCGNSTHPATLFDSAGTGDASNEVRINTMAIFAYYGHGAVFRSNGTAARDFYVSKLRIEGIQFDPVTIAADNLVIGDSTATSSINNWTCTDCRMISAYPGQSAIRLDANNSGNAPYYIKYSGSVGGGAPQGKGLTVNFGRDSTFEFFAMNTEDTNVTLGASAGSNIGISAPGNAQLSYTYSISGGTLVWPVVVAGSPAGQTAYVTATGPAANGTLLGGNAPGSGAIYLSTNHGHQYSSAVGTNSVVVGGSDNEAAGTASAAIGGVQNIINGVNSAAIGGTRVTDRTWTGARCHASGSLTDFSGDANFCEVVIRCQAAATNGSTCRASSDNAAAGAANVVNIPAAATYVIQLDCTAQDRTTPGNNEAWPAWTMKLSRPTNAASTVLGTNTKPTPLTSGTVTGSDIAATADTTQGGLNVTFTAPSTNSSLWDFTCHASTHQVQ